MGHPKIFSFINYNSPRKGALLLSEIITNNDYESGKVIVALNQSFTSHTVPDYDIRPIVRDLDYEKADIIYQQSRSANGGDSGDILLIYLRDKSKAAVIDAIEKLSATPNVLYAEPDYVEDLFVVPNDPLYHQLWGTQKVQAPMAWNYSTGSTHVAVGVIDTGIDHEHPDIRRNMWTSPNRRIVNGWNFANDNDFSMDTDGHGTHVAGTIGAVGDNHIGITGICWHVKVVAMKFGLDIASAIASINFANQFRIPILNASWGGRAYSRSLKYAIDHYDGLFVAAAGNDGTNNDRDPVFPASYDSDNIISVAASRPDDSLAAFSNFGVRSVHLAAPGTNILSLGLYSDYSPLNGTSMAAPHVAGAAALLKAYMPGISTRSIKNIILGSAVRRPVLANRVATGGMLNVNAMFTMANNLRRRGNL